MIDIESKINSICCKNCKLFVDNKCSGDDSTYHEDEKEILVEIGMDKYKQSNDAYMKHWAENINDYYVCEEFEE